MADAAGVGRYSARCVTCHGYWRAANSRQWSVLAPTETDCTVCPPVVVNYRPTQLKFTDCSRHESTQARSVLVATTMVVLHEPDHAGAAEPRDPGVSWSPLFVSYSDFDPNFSLTSAVSGTMHCDLRFHKSDERGLRCLPSRLLLFCAGVVLKCVVPFGPPRQKFIAVPCIPPHPLFQFFSPLVPSPYQYTLLHTPLVTNALQHLSKMKFAVFRGVTKWFTESYFSLKRSNL